jgi:hypothetical protein
MRDPYQQLRTGLESLPSVSPETQSAVQQYDSEYQKSAAALKAKQAQEWKDRGIDIPS